MNSSLPLSSLFHQQKVPPSNLALIPLQLVSGVSIPAYWLAAWLWDNLSYQLTVWMIVILVSAFPNTDQLSGAWR